MFLHVINSQITNRSVLIKQTVQLQGDLSPIFFFKPILQTFVMIEPYFFKPAPDPPCSLSGRH